MILYFVTPEHMQFAKLIELVTVVASAGVEYIQFRSKEPFSQEKIRQATAIHAITKQYSIPLIINDDLELALYIQAEGIHVGQDDVRVATIRSAMPNAIIGLSLNSYNDFTTAQEQNLDIYVDYYATSPLFSTGTKQCANAPWGLHNLQKLRASTTKTIIAIGGIDSHNIASVLEHGADGVALVSAISSAQDPTKKIAELRLCAQQNIVT